MRAAPTKMAYGGSSTWLKGGRSSGLDRARLPAPEHYFREIAGLKVTGRREWKDALCPFHPDTRPSLRINSQNGAYRCMACGAHGPDIIAFHGALRNLNFVATCKALGAWKEEAR